MKVSLFDRRVIDHFDWVTIALISPLMLVSLYLIFEINTDLAYRQLAYMCIGLVVFVVVFMLPIRRFIWLIPFGYWTGIALLAIVKYIGTERQGAARWLEVPFLHVTFQPSELFKPIFILMLAYLIHESPPPPNGYGWKAFFKLSLYTLLPFFLIAIEPDLGTALLLLMIGGGILLAAGLKRKIWVTLIVATAISGVFGYELLHDYQKKRIEDFISKNSSYHVRQSMIAIGSGGLAGKHSEEATQTQLRFLPIAASDFIFAYYVERFGFVGALALILLYILLITHLLSLNLKTHEDYLAMVTITGVAIMLFLYMAINIAMTIGLAPVVGVPLPLFSSGGSSFMNFVILFAVIENLLAFRFYFLYTSALRSH
ncbi:MAG: rod shape-determining protein RodA [Helicobacteraceae bacterium]|jgi:rod shape determining protein RodA|nr:rod shape-determining protein RodA [Helicobacteraceae bacterium]